MAWQNSFYISSLFDKLLRLLNESLLVHTDGCSLLVLYRQETTFEFIFEVMHYSSSFFTFLKPLKISETLSGELLIGIPSNSFVSLI